MTQIKYRTFRILELQNLDYLVNKFLRFHVFNGQQEIATPVVTNFDFP